MGNFRDYAKIMNAMGHVADKKHYIEIRQMNRDYKRQEEGKLKHNNYVFALITKLEDHLVKEMKNKGP